MKTTANIINRLGQNNCARKYLEFGEHHSNTFFEVNFPLKVAVNAAQRFDLPEEFFDDFYYTPADTETFFHTFPAMPISESFRDTDGKLCFDIIHCSGVRGFEPLLDILKQSLPYAHEGTIWVIDSTVPSDPYAALPDKEIALDYKKCANIYGMDWQGDGYKIVFAIHDFFPQLNYCTLISGCATPLTVAWFGSQHSQTRSEASTFQLMSSIARLSFFDLLKYAHLFNFVDESDLWSKLGNNIDCCVSHTDHVAWKKIIRPIKSISEVTFLQKIVPKDKKIHELITLLQQQLTIKGQILETLRQQLTTKDQVLDMLRQVSIAKDKQLDDIQNALHKQVMVNNILVSGFPNFFQQIILLFYKPFAKTFFSSKAYGRYQNNPFDFFLKAKNPFNQLMHYLLSVAGPWPANGSDKR